MATRLFIYCWNVLSTVFWILMALCDFSFCFPSNNVGQQPMLTDHVMCRQPLGMTYDLNATFVNFTLTSTEGNASDAGLYGPETWAASKIGDHTYVQINMAEPVMVTGMFIQGDPETDQWVSSFHVTYSVDCITYYPVFDVGINQNFAGNLDPYSVAVIEFPNIFCCKMHASNSDRTPSKCIGAKNGSHRMFGQHVHRHTSGGLERGPRQRQHGGQVPVRENHHSPHHSAQFPLR